MSFDALKKHLETTPLEETKRQLALGLCAGEEGVFSRQWVAEREAEIAAQVAARAEARADEGLTIARQANAMSKSARKLAIIAVFLSAIAIAVKVAIAIWQSSRSF